MITQAIGGNNMDWFLCYIINAIHCLKWCTVWATYDQKWKVALKAKPINAKLDKISSSPTPSDSVHKMECAYDEKLQPETQLLKLYNQVCSVSLHGPHLPLYQISLEQPYSWIHHGFQPISMLPSDHASWCSCWTWFAKITKKWSEDWWTLRGINWMPNIMRCFLTAIIVLSCRLWLAYYTSLPHLLW